MTDPNQVTTPNPEVTPGQEDPQVSQDRPLTVKEAESLMESAVEKAFRRAQSHTDAVVKKVREEQSLLEKRLGRPLDDKEKSRVQNQIADEMTSTPPKTSGQQPGQGAPGAEEPPLDPVNAEALRIMEANKAVIDMDNDPEAKMIVTDQGVYAFHKSVDDASQAKAKRLAESGPTDEPQDPRTPSSTGMSGGSVDQTYANKSMDEVWADFDK